MCRVKASSNRFSHSSTHNHITAASVMHGEYTCLGYPWEQRGRARLGMSTSGGYWKWTGLDRTSDSQDWDSRVMWNVGTMAMWVEMCWRCCCQEKKAGKTKEEVFGRDEEGHARGMTSCLLEVNGEFAVGTSDGKSRKKKMHGECRYKPGHDSDSTFQVLCNTFFWKRDTHPPPHNANNIETYIFIMLFFWKIGHHQPPPTMFHNPWMALYCFNKRE